MLTRHLLNCSCLLDVFLKNICLPYCIGFVFTSTYFLLPQPTVGALEQTSLSPGDPLCMTSSTSVWRRKAAESIFVSKVLRNLFIMRSGWCRVPCVSTYESSACRKVYYMFEQISWTKPLGGFRAAKTRM